MMEFLAYIVARVVAGVLTAVILAALFNQYQKMVAATGTVVAMS